MDNPFFQAIGRLIGILLGLVIFKPIIAFIIGFLSGGVMQLLFGNTIVQVFSWFHILIEPIQIPFIFAIIALIGSFFRTVEYPFIEYDDEEEE